MKQVIIIGGGFSSLCLAALLVKNGRYKVIVLEKTGRPGGYARELEIEGYRFPMGPRYLWDFGPGQPALGFFEKLGILRADDFVSLDRDGFDEVFVGNKLVMRVPMGWERYQTKLEEEFPKEREGIARFFDRCRKIDSVFRDLIFKNVDYAGYRAIPRALLKSGSPLESAVVMLTNAGRTLESEFQRCRLSPLLRTILSAHLAIVCEVPKNMSLVGYAVATLNYHRGSFYPKENIEFLVQALVQFISEHGGEIRLNATVKSMHAKNNAIARVQCEEGDFRGDIFISNIDPTHSYQMLDIVDGRVPHTDYALSNSLLSAFFGLEVPASSEFPFDRSQRWIIESEQTLSSDIFARDRETDKFFPEYLYVNSPSAFADTGLPCGPTKESATITAFAPAPCHFWHSLGQAELSDYRMRKTEAIQRAVQSAVWANLGDNLRTSTLLTPLDYEDQLNAAGGHIYGKRFRPQDIFVKRVPFRSKVENLYFCSAFTNQPGLASCVRGAQHLYNLLTNP